MGLSFVWFTFAGDAGCLRQSLRSVAAVAPRAARHVFFDPDAPLPPDMVWELHLAGVHVRPSPAPHGGNLTGRTNLEQLLDALAAAGAGGGWVVKIDSDTVVQSLNWLLPGMAAGSPVAAVLFAATIPPQPCCGPCYALRADLPQRLRSTLAEPPAELPFYDWYPEDHCVSVLLDATLSPTEVCRLPVFPTHFFAGFQYDGDDPDGDEELFPAYHPISVVTFGNRSGVAGESDSAKRAAAARTMQQFLDGQGIPS